MAVAQLPVHITTPDSGGNGYPALFAGSAHRDQLPAFLKDVDGSWYGHVRVPQNYASGGKIVLSVAANATSGVTRLNVHTAPIADAESYNPASYTSETAQDVTVPATAYLRKDVTWTLTPTLAAADDLLVRVQHDGAHVNDTLAVDTLLVGAAFEYTTT